MCEDVRPGPAGQSAGLRDRVVVEALHVAVQPLRCSREDLGGVGINLAIRHGSTLVGWRTSCTSIGPSRGRILRRDRSPLDARPQGGHRVYVTSPAVVEMAIGPPWREGVTGGYGR